MKIKIFLILLLGIIAAGCDDIPDGVVETPNNSDYVVLSVDAPAEFTHTNVDSTITTTMQVSSKDDISEVYLVLQSTLDQSVVIPKTTMEAGEGTTYSAQLVMKESFPSGSYEIVYYVKNIVNEERIASVHKVKYDNGTDNIPPVIENLNMPDEIVKERRFNFSVEASDENGYGDIYFVYFEAFRPDGSQLSDGAATKFVMHDDGNFEVWGDMNAGDGIFSYKNLFAQTAQSGEWRFEFEALDKGGKVSNTIVHTINVLE